jgi:hypothetical protein
MIPIAHISMKKSDSDCDPKSKQTQREIIGFLESLHSASKKTNFKRGIKLSGMNFHDAVPTNHILKTKLETLNQERQPRRWNQEGIGVGESRNRRTVQRTSRLRNVTCVVFEGFPCGSKALQATPKLLGQ